MLSEKGNATFKSSITPKQAGSHDTKIDEEFAQEKEIRIESVDIDKRLEKIAAEALDRLVGQLEYERIGVVVLSKPQLLSTLFFLFLSFFL